MRRLIDVLLGVMLVGLLGGAMLYVKHERVESALREHARAERRRFQQQISLQVALEEGNLNERGFPRTIDPDWFNGDAPANLLLGPSNPWVEIAPASDHDRSHPHDLVAMHEGTARFWYNPWLGTVRARVPAGVSDNATLELYNFVNEVELDELFQ